MANRTQLNGDDNNPALSDALSRAGGVLCDLDGTLYVEDRLIDGAAETIALLRERRVALRFLTNTTTRSRRSLFGKLRAFDLDVDEGEILSAAYAGVLYLRSIGSPRCRLLLSDDAAKDYAEFERDDERPEAVVVGDIGAAWDYPLLNSLFRQMMAGAELIALHRNRYFETADGLALDAGPFVAAVEYASGRAATVIGKPAEAFFDLALRDLDLPQEKVIIIGDDIENDIAAGQAQGLTGILVETGKFRRKLAAQTGVTPSFAVESVDSLRGLLANLR